MRPHHLTPSANPINFSSIPTIMLHSIQATNNVGQENKILAEQSVQTVYFHFRRDTSIPSKQIADMIATTWFNIYIALTPIIGKNGVAAIYKRSLHIVRRDYPWLMYAQECKRAAGDFTTLRTTLSLQPSMLALAAHRSLFGTFYNLLRHLIGNELTEKLLQHVIDHDLNG